MGPINSSASTSNAASIGPVQLGNISYAAKSKGAWIPWAIGGGVVVILAIAAMLTFRSPIKS